MATMPCAKEADGAPVGKRLGHVWVQLPEQGEQVEIVLFVGGYPGLIEHETIFGS